MKYLIELTAEQIELMENLVDFSIGKEDAYCQEDAEYALSIIFENL